MLLNLVHKINNLFGNKEQRASDGRKKWKLDSSKSLSSEI